MPDDDSEAPPWDRGRGAAGTPMPAYTSVPAGGSPGGESGTHQWYSARPAAAVAAAVVGGGVRPVPASAQAPLAGSAAPVRPGPANGPSDTAVRPAAGLLSDLPFSAPSTVATWIATLGAFIAGVAVILPWRATPDLPYLTVWGAAMPSVVVAAILALVTGLVAITPSRLAPRVRWGYLPFFVGAFGVGVAWMWQSTYAPDIGLWVYAAGSIVAAVGGAVSLSGWAEPTTG